MANVGNISVKLGMDSEEFRQAMNSVGADATKFANRLEGLGGSVFDGVEAGAKGGSRKFSNTLNQIAFGAEDFFSQLGTGGVSAAIRATSNNTSQIAAAFGPIPLLLTVVGTTLASVIVPKMAEWLFSTKDIAHEMDQISNRAKAATDRMEEIFRLEQRFGSMKSDEARGSAKTAIEGEIDLRERQLKRLQETREVLRKYIKDTKDAASIYIDPESMGSDEVAAVFELQRKAAAEGQRLFPDAFFPRTAAEDELKLVEKQISELRKAREKSALEAQILEKMGGNPRLGAASNLSAISSDIFGSTQAFSAINRAITNSTSKTEEKIEHNTQRTADAVTDMNNRQKDTTSDAAAAAAIGIAEIERF